MVEQWFTRSVRVPLISPSVSGFAQRACRLRYDLGIHFLLDRCYGHVVRFKAEGYVIRFGVLVLSINSCASTETKARAQV